MNAILALVIANIIWGAASPIFKYALTDIPPFTLAFIRFFYPWLLLNLVTEPVWSGLIAGCLGAVTIGFFKLPKLIKREQMSNNN